MTGSLNGRMALITGASSGIGAGVARRFAREGAKLVLAARRADRLDALADELRGLGAEVLARPTDVTREDEVLGLYADAEAFGEVDILVNNAGMVSHRATLDLGLDEWNQLIALNLTAAFLCAREAMRVMKPRGRGKIINIGSLSAQMPRAETIAYATSKYGMEGMTRSLALDGREFGITASIVHPGLTMSDLAADSAARTPGPMLMEADTTAQVIALMASMPFEANLLTATILPIAQPYLGRG
ncbi:SDR family oxidoreductase [Sphingomonas sp. MMS24-J13]|uniref:SDR family oxidoreductase n=1 Tax=Sphingomonas sp. MMS24-J13 TaxID=3238686 RepID=UPI00384F6698